MTPGSKERKNLDTIGERRDIPADTKHNIFVVFMLEGYVKIMLDFMLECLVF